MPDMADLDTYMTRLLGPIAVFASTKAREVGVAVLADLVQVTPVDTGRAVSNWKVSLDVPDDTPIDPFVPSPKGHTRKGLWTHAIEPHITQQINAPYIISTGNAVLANKQPGQVIYITNSVDYIGELNSGSSFQAPAGFVDRAVIIGETIVGRARIVP